MHPAQLGECLWEEWNCQNGDLLRKNCVFNASDRSWKTTAKYYQIPDEFRI